MNCDVRYVACFYTEIISVKTVIAILTFNVLKTLIKRNKLTKINTVQQNPWNRVVLDKPVLRLAQEISRLL